MNKKWWLRVAEDNDAQLQFRHDNSDSVRIAIAKAETGTSYDIQLNQKWLRAKLNHQYLIRFLGRADDLRSIFVGFARAHEPWTNLGLYNKIELSLEWQTFEQTFVATKDEDDARIHFDLGHSNIPVELSSISLRDLSEDKLVEPSFGTPPSDKCEISDAAPKGRLKKAIVPERSFILRNVSLAKLTSELLARSRDGSFNSNEAAILLGCEILEALPLALNVHNNRLSVRRYSDLFGAFYEFVGPPRPRLDGATIVDLGCGSLNPYGLLFLFLMLGGRRGIAIDLDEIEDMPRAVRALADLSARMLIHPEEIIGDHPIAREQILQNIASFDLSRLHSGDVSGLDSDRLSYRRQSVYELPLLDKEVDFVISNAFFEHIPRVDDAIAEISRVMCKGSIGVHTIDGSDHRRYDNPACHPLEFLTKASNEPIVHGCNRIRPLEFAALFERHGFEVLSVEPFEQVDVNLELRNRLVEPFRSMADEFLAVTIAKVVIHRL